MNHDQRMDLRTNDCLVYILDRALRGVTLGVAIVLIAGCPSRPASSDSGPTNDSLPVEQPSLDQPSLDQPSLNQPTTPSIGNNVGTAETASASAFSFVPFERNAGVDFVIHNGEEALRYTFLEGFGAGAGLIDLDRDGDLDLWLPGGGSISNEPQVTFENHGVFRNQSGQFKNRTQAMRIADSRTYSCGVNVGDYDQDGFADVLVSGYGGLQLFRNLGDGTFDEVTEHILDEEVNWNSSTAWADVNNDGQLDVYVAHYARWNFERDLPCFGRNRKRDRCPPTKFEGEQDQLFIQTGDGNLVAKSLTDPWNPKRDLPEHKAGPSNVLSGFRGLGVIASDFDHDGDVDFYVTNDEQNNLYWVNDGEGGFEESAARSGLAMGSRAKPDGSMGIATADLDQNGWMDLLVTNYENEFTEIYGNLGQNRFQTMTARMGATAFGVRRVAWGTQFFDADHDGDEDLVIISGHTAMYPDQGAPEQVPLFAENQSGRLIALPFDSDNWLSKTIAGRGLATGDLDRDGDIDWVATCLNQPVHVIENRTQSIGTFLQLEVIGRQSNRDAIGAVVTCSLADGSSMLRHRIGGGSYASTSAADLHFGFRDAQLADGKIPSLRIQWPSGELTELRNVAANQLLQIIEPAK